MANDVYRLKYDDDDDDDDGGGVGVGRRSSLPLSEADDDHPQHHRNHRNQNYHHHHHHHHHHHQPQPQRHQQQQQQQQQEQQQQQLSQHRSMNDDKDEIDNYPIKMNGNIDNDSIIIIEKEKYQQMPTSQPQQLPHQSPLPCLHPNFFPINMANLEEHLNQPQPTSSQYLCIRANLVSLLASMIFTFTTIIINLATLAYIHERVPYYQPPLPDMAFEMLPKYDRALDLSEYIIIFLTISALFMILCHRYRWIIMIRLFVILGFLYVFRAACMGATQVPVSNPQYYCSPRLNLTSVSAWDLTKTIMWRIVFMSVGMGLSVNGHHTYCGDYIYSGHTIIMVAANLFLIFYWLSDRKQFGYRLLRYGCHLLVIIGIISILIARGHYLVDIILGVIITKTIFKLYHSLCHYAILLRTQMDLHMQQLKHLTAMLSYDRSEYHRQTLSNLYQYHRQQYEHYHHLYHHDLNVWWFKFFEFFERNAIENRIIVKTEFEWPWKMFAKHPNSFMSV